MINARVDHQVSGLRLGSFAVVYLFGALSAFSIPVQVGSTPENGLELTLEAIRSARKNLQINIYEMKSEEVADAIIERIESGVTVQILAEGQPVGGLTDAAIAVRNRIVRAMRESPQPDNFFVMSNEEESRQRRFRFDHAKYTIVDGRALLIGSENYSASRGKTGNRGWKVWVEDEAVAAQFAQVFANDSDPSHEDVHEIVGDTVRGFFRWLGLVGLPEPLQSRPFVRGARQTLDARHVVSLLSPDNGLRGLLGLIERAEHTLEIEQMTLSPRWGTSGKSSPLLNALIAAARRGVKVRVLLNDETVFGQRDDDEGFEPLAFTDGQKTKNEETVDILNVVASRENLDLEARIADVEAMGVRYIHNKGALSDGRYTLISSINWNQNSVENNREAAVVLDSTDIYHYYHKLFEADWEASEGRRVRLTALP